MIYDDIRHAIGQGRFAPGERIIVHSLAAESGVSRIPIMQALRRLEVEGFVRINPRKGVQVASLSVEEFRERFLIMTALETLCLRESAGRITVDLTGELRGVQDELVAARRAKNAARAARLDTHFHLVICQAAGLPQALQLLRNLFDRGEYYRLIMHARRGGFAKESLAEHERILRALEAGDVTRAAKALEEHRIAAMRRLSATT